MEELDINPIEDLFTKQQAYLDEGDGSKDTQTIAACLLSIGTKIEEVCEVLLDIKEIMRRR